MEGILTQFWKLNIICLLIFITFSSTIILKAQENLQLRSFEENMEYLRNYFHIPEMAVLVQKGEQQLFENYWGKADQQTLFPIASITKVFSATLIMQLVESGDLLLTEPVKKYLPELDLSDDIQVQHILSHTSQGEVGKQFYYSYRFGLLTKVIEKYR